MPDNLSIQPTASVNTANAGGAPVRSIATAAPPDQAAPAPMSSPNPTLELNAALGLVVIEFRNTAGAVTSSIPSQQQLAAYQLWQQAGIGNPPPGSGSSTGSGATVSGPEASGGNNRLT